MMDGKARISVCTLQDVVTLEVCMSYWRIHMYFPFASMTNEIISFRPNDSTGQPTHYISSSYGVFSLGLQHRFDASPLFYISVILLCNKRITWTNDICYIQFSEVATSEVIRRSKCSRETSDPGLLCLQITLVWGLPFVVAIKQNF